MYGKHLISHIKHNELENNNTLYVVGVISNPSRFHSRYRLYREWEKHMLLTPNVKLITVETAFGDRKHEVTCKENPDHLQLRTRSSIWIKEPMVNLGFRKIMTQYPDARYFAWIDCDVFFRNPGWALETIHQLQHYDVVQPWSQCCDLGPHGQTMTLFDSFANVHQRRIPKQRHHKDTYKYAHSGFAWACTKRFLENLPRNLMDFCLLGSGDWHMAWAMIGEVEATLYTHIGPNYNRRAIEWQQRAMKVTHGEVGYVQGTIEHQFHGSKKNRFYKERNRILIDCGFDPDTHLLYDEQGLVQLVGNAKLEHEIHKYNLSRFEDGIEL